MKNKGFTLVELLVVIVIIVVISTIGYAGITAAQQKIKENLWQGQIDAIESAAQLYGEDNKNRLTGICNIGSENVTNCLTIHVQDLIDENYLRTDEVDEEGRKVIINESLDENDANYYANNLEVFVYMDEVSEVVYAKLNYVENSES